MSDIKDKNEELSYENENVSSYNMSISDDFDDENVLQKYGKVVGIAIVVVIIAAVSYFFYNKNAQEKNVKASIDINRILPLLASGDEEKALNGGLVDGIQVVGLKQIASKYSGMPQGQLAAMLAGNIYLSKGAIKDAEKYFEQSLDAESKVVVSGANAGLAACKESEKEYTEAAALYEKSAEMSEATQVKPKFQFFAALCYEKAGNKEKAEKLHKEIIKTNEFSEYAGMSKTVLTRLGIDFAY